MRTLKCLTALALGLSLACTGGGAADSDDTGAETDADTGTDTGIDTDTETDTTNSFLRFVNLMRGPDGADIYLNESTAPLTQAPLPRGGNTDAAGSDYAAFPPGTYDVDFVDVGSGDVVSLEDVEASLGVYTTLVAMTPLGYENHFTPLALAVTDDISAASAGSHRLTIVSAAMALGANLTIQPTSEGLPDMTAPDISGVSWGDVVTVTVPSGEVSLYASFQAKEAPQFAYVLDLEDGGWSYLYLLADSMTGFSTTALHHVRGEDNAPIVGEQLQ